MDESAESIQGQLDALTLNRRHGVVFALCSAGLFFESLNLQLMSFVAPQVAKEWHLGPRLLGATISAAIFGMMLGTYVFGAVADRHGRRATFQITVAIFSVLTVISGASLALWQLVLTRFGAGVGIGGSIPVETAVLAEFSPQAWRGRLLALWGIFLPLAALVAPLCVSLMPEEFGWRGLLFLGGIPALLVLVARRAIPETPQFLFMKGRTEEARAAIAWISCRPLVAVPASKVAEPQTVLSSVAPERILFSRRYRRTTAINWLLYFGTFFSYYGFVLWMPALLGGYRGYSKTEIVHFMLGLAVAGLGGRLAMTIVVGRLSRVPLIVGCAFLSAVALIEFSLQTDRQLTMVWGYIAAFLLEGIFGAVIPFVAESYPTRSRATGVGWAGGMGRLGTALAPLTIGSLVRTEGHYAVMVLALGSILAAVCMLFAKRDLELTPSPGSGELANEVTGDG